MRQFVSQGIWGHLLQNLFLVMKIFVPLMVAGDSSQMFSG